MAFISSTQPVGTIKIARQAGYAKPYGELVTEEQIYDEYYYDYLTMSYKKIGVPGEIEKEKKDIKSLIAYYYNR